jgi:hypothetical protein
MNSATALSALKAFMETPELASLGPESRPGTSSVGSLELQLETVFQQFQITSARGELLRAVIYLWHDHLDSAHQIAQSVENRDGSLIHAMMHRREPDYPNAKYWFRRAGEHPAFHFLSKKIAGLREDALEAAVRNRLFSGGIWNAIGFVDLVEEASDREQPKENQMLQEVQKLEFESVIEAIVTRS